MLPDATPYLEWITRFTGIGAMVLAVECWLCAREFRAGGLLDWQVCQWEKRNGRLPGWLRRCLLPVMNWPGCMGVISACGIAGVALAFWPQILPLRQAALLLLVVASALWRLRGVALAMYGAEQVRSIVAVALLLQSFAPASPLVAAAALAFLAAMAAGIYMGSGLLKCRQAEWRQGTALVQLLRVKVMGWPPAGDWLARFPAVARLLGWGVLAFQIGFPLAFAHPVVAGVLILVGGLMHLGIGAMMGVNRFFWSMLSLHPAVWYVAQIFAPR